MYIHMYMYVYINICSAAVRQGGGIAAARVASPSTPGNGRISPVDVIEDTENSAVNRRVVYPHPPPRCLGSLLSGCKLDVF